MKEELRADAAVVCDVCRSAPSGELSELPQLQTHWLLQILHIPLVQKAGNNQK